MSANEVLGRPRPSVYSEDSEAPGDQQSVFTTKAATESRASPEQIREPQRSGRVEVRSTNTPVSRYEKGRGLLDFKNKHFGQDVPSGKQITIRGDSPDHAAGAGLSSAAF
ncbi:hypothetical protein Q5P01_005880 [Channa striata]|uniref:Uncharacterized protein n=1 Tax=Channa striata TaxID=64152 RepID=A0AA88NQ32_CHASR|nr:hypothetical protein Q5P01_005880 [Channa striata]